MFICVWQCMVALCENMANESYSISHTKTHIPLEELAKTLTKVCRRDELMIGGLGIGGFGMSTMIGASAASSSTPSTASAERKASSKGDSSMCIMANDWML